MGLFFVLQSCSSQGFGSLAAGQSQLSHKVVYVVPNLEPRAMEYMPEVASVLRESGFTVSPDPLAPFKVQVTFAGGGFDLSCTILMSEKGVPVASGKGVNPGWGVWLARDKAYQGVFSGALKEFSRRITARQT